jgi:hypothetical protein
MLNQLEQGKSQLMMTAVKEFGYIICRFLQHDIPKNIKAVSLRRCRETVISTFIYVSYTRCARSLFQEMMNEPLAID